MYIYFGNYLLPSLVLIYFSFFVFINWFLHLPTFYSLNSKTQIDFTLISRPHFPIVADSKTALYENIATQHRSLIAVLRISLGRRQLQSDDFARRRNLKSTIKVKIQSTYWPLQSSGSPRNDYTIIFLSILRW